MDQVKTQRRFKRELKAGVPMTIDQRSEFIFIEEGVDLLVRADSSIMDGRQRGDHIRPGAPFDSVTFTSAVDQVIEFIMGWGEFNRLIVTGELNVSQYVTTVSNGVAPSLPFDIEKTVGIENLDTVNNLRSDVEITYAPTTNECAVVFWKGEIVLVGKNQLHFIRPDTAAGAFDRTVALDTTLVEPFRSNSDVNGAYIDEFGQIYFAGNGELFRVSVNGGTVQKLQADWGRWIEPPFTDNTYYKPLGLTYHSDGYVYGLSGNYVVKTSKEGEILDWFHRDALGWPSTKSVLGRFRGKWVAWASNSSTTYYELDEDFSYVRTVSGQTSLSVNTGIYQYPEDPRLLVFPKEAGVELKHIDDNVTYGKLYVHDVGDTSSKKFFHLTESPRAFATSGLAGVWDENIRRVLGAVIGGAVPDNYLDFVTGFKYSDGLVTRAVNSGTQTFAKRDIVDVFGVVDGSDVTVSVLPNLFDQ